MGILLTMFAASFQPAMLQLILIAIELKIDPFMVYVSLSGAYFQELLWIAQTARILLLLFLSQRLLTSFRVFVPLYLGMTTIFLKFVKGLKFSNVTYKSVQIYKQLIIQQNVIRDFERDLTSVGLVGVFIILVLTTAQIILSLSEKKFAMFVVLAAIFAIAFSTLAVTFLICCSINEISAEIIKRWKSKCGIRTHDQFLHRLLQSIKTLYVPVGEVGEMDWDLKLNYYNAVTDYTVNV